MNPIMAFGSVRLDSTLLLMGVQVGMVVQVVLGAVSASLTLDVEIV